MATAVRLHTNRGVLVVVCRAANRIMDRVVLIVITIIGGAWFW